MPATTNSPGQAIAGSFLGLQSYTEAQSNLFFGRDAETDTLTSLIDLNTLTIVFGRSGTGKTSLLNAGVFPRLRKSFCLPFRIRLEFNDNSPGLITQVKKVLKEEIDKYGFKVDAYASSETLWEYFHREPLWKTVTPILVFDQFEEMFTLAKSNPRFASIELPLFWEELSDLIENNIPEKLKEKFLNQKERIEYNYRKRKAKIVFSFREEYLPEFETLAAKIPSLKYSRFRLLPMNGNQAYEVITKTWKENISAKEAKHLVSYFTNEPGMEDHSLVTVEPSLLSQVCAYIDKERIESGGGKVSAELLTKYPKETILRSIYNEAMIAADTSLNLSREKAAGKNLIKVFVEEKLITTEGYRTRYNLSAGDEALKPGINVLTTKYFIREDDNVVELTHDVLAPIIKSDREQRRKEIATTIERKRARKRALLLLLITFFAAAITYYFVTKKAKADRTTAKQEAAAATLEKRLVTDSVNNIRKNMQDSIKVYDKIIKEKKGLLTTLRDAGIIKTDSSGTDVVDTSKIQQISRDLALISKLKKDTEMALRNENEKLRSQLNEKEIELDRLIKLQGISTPAPESNKNITELKNQITALKIKLDDIQPRYELIKKENDALKIERNTQRKTIDSLLKLVGNVNLLGKLYYQNDGISQVKPANIPLYLIAKNKNRRIINNASVYEISCYDKELNGAKASFKTVTDANGNYAFRNIPEGEYLLKICTYYGGFYNIKITDSKKRLERNFDASPPVRFPYSKQ